MDVAPEWVQKKKLIDLPLGSILFDSLTFSTLVFRTMWLGRSSRGFTDLVANVGIETDGTSDEPEVVNFCSDFFFDVGYIFIYCNFFSWIYSYVWWLWSEVDEKTWFWSEFQIFYWVNLQLPRKSSIFNRIQTKNMEKLLLPIKKQKYFNQNHFPLKVVWIMFFFTFTQPQRTSNFLMNEYDFINFCVLFIFFYSSLQKKRNLKWVWKLKRSAVYFIFLLKRKKWKTSLKWHWVYKTFEINYFTGKHSMNYFSE